MMYDSDLKPLVVYPQDINDEGMVRLGEKCMEDMTREYISRHSKADLESYKTFLRGNLTYRHWLRSIIDPEKTIACMDRIRNDKIRHDAAYRALCYEETDNVSY